MNSNKAYFDSRGIWKLDRTNFGAHIIHSLIAREVTVSVSLWFYWNVNIRVCVCVCVFLCQVLFNVFLRYWMSHWLTKSIYWILKKSNFCNDFLINTKIERNNTMSISGMVPFEFRFIECAFGKCKRQCLKICWMWRVHSLPLVMICLNKRLACSTQSMWHNDMIYSYSLASRMPWHYAGAVVLFNWLSCYVPCSQVALSFPCPIRSAFNRSVQCSKAQFKFIQMIDRLN